MFQFVALLEKTRERAIYMKREAVQDAEDGPRKCFYFLLPDRTLIISS